MLRALIETVRGMNHTVSRDAVLEQLDNNLTAINADVIPGLTSIKAFFKETDADLKDYPLLSSLDRMAKLKSKDAADLVSKLIKLYGSFSSSGSLLRSTMLDELPEVLTMNVITARQSALLQVNKDMASMTLYVLDLMLFATQNSESSIKMLKIKENAIKANLQPYSSAVKAYHGHVSKIVKDIPKVASVVMSGDSDKTSMLEGVVKKQGKLIDFATSGFVGNPIYHIRTYFIDREVAKYNVLKDKKKILELKILDLKVKRTGEVDPQLERQIEYYEEKLDKTEYTIRKIEDE